MDIPGFLQLNKLIVNYLKQTFLYGRIIVFLLLYLQCSLPQCKETTNLEAIKYPENNFTLLLY